MANRSEDKKRGVGKRKLDKPESGWDSDQGTPECEMSTKPQHHYDSAIPVD